jgi:hypothetical protein
MGQQQLLLLVLGTVIVGVAIVVGINVFQSGAVQANQDAVVQDCLTIAGKAMNWAKTPQLMGGGLDPATGTADFSNLNFGSINYTQSATMDFSNANGSITLSDPSATGVTITGYGVEGETNSPFQVQVVVDISAADPNDVITTTITQNSGS